MRFLYNEPSNMAYIKKRFLYLFKGKTATIIGYIIGSKVVAKIFEIISGIIVARNLGVDGKGVFAACFVIPSIISTFGHLGLPVSNIYYIGQRCNRETILSNSIVFFILASFLYMLGGILILPLLKKSYFSGINSEVVIYITLSLIPLLLAKHFYSDFLRALEKYKEFNVSSILQTSTRLTLIIVFASLKILTVETAITAVFIASIVSNIYGFVNVYKSIKLKKLIFDFNQFKQNFVYGAKEYVGNVFATLNVRIDLFIFASFMDRTSIGLYSLSETFVGLFLFIPNSISVVLLPKISKEKDNKQYTYRLLLKSVLYNIATLLACWIVFIAIGKYVIQLTYGEQFANSYKLSVIMLVGAIFLSISMVINKFFSGIGRPEIKSIIRGINLPMKALFLVYLIRAYGLFGAAWAFTINTFCLLSLSIFYFYRLKNYEGS